MKHTPPICLDCKHFWFEPGWGGTVITPGESAEMTCRRGHYRDYGSDIDLSRLRTADGCSDLEEDA